jgi:uncharacterized protein YecT (DUF1311 family)
MKFRHRTNEGSVLSVLTGNQAWRLWSRNAHKGLSVLLTACAAWFAPASQAASFDCEKAATEVEKTVCSNSELSRLDEALDQAYSAAHAGAGKERMRATQLRWIAQRNACKVQECIRNAYLARLEALEMTLPTKADPWEATKFIWKDGHHRFRLMRGRGTDVCEAYMAMLRGTYFKRPPYCDRPEPTDVPGFTPLERVALDANSVLAIAAVEQQFMSGEMDLGVYRTTPDADGASVAKQFSSFPEDPSPSQFATPVDIDNDGLADRVVYWPEHRAKCGDIFPMTVAGRSFVASRRAFALDLQGRLDVLRTRELFGHPYPYVVSIRDETSGVLRARVIQKFRPMTWMFTFTKYRGTFYFDGRMDEWGDFENSRREDRALLDIIGVYERRNSKTVQHCEIRWLGPY